MTTGATALVGLIAVGTAACIAPAQRSAGSPSPPRFHLVSYDSAGALDPASRARYEAALADASTASDILVLSHGWWNDAASADCTYSRMLDGFTADRPPSIPASRKVVTIAIYWPSAVFPIGEPGCVSAAGNVPVEESSRTRPGFRTADVPGWISAAFPEAAATDRDQLRGLIEKAATLEGLTRAEGNSLLGSLAKLERGVAGDVPPVEAAGEQDIRLEPSRLADAWIPEAGQRAEFESSGLSVWLTAANVFTFWTMKARAGAVGSSGVYELIKALQPLRTRGVRIHLVGHSFGGKLLAASLTGHGRPPNRVDSFLILQGALSHFAFSTAEELRNVRADASQPGLYRTIATDRLVHGAFAATHSKHDTANAYWYPKGVRLSRDDFETGTPPGRWGSLGFDGFQGPQATAASFPLTVPPALGLWNIDANAVVSGHSDVFKPEIFRLMWAIIGAGLK